LARKKSKGSKKARAKKSRAKKSAEKKPSPGDELTTAEDVEESGAAGAKSEKKSKTAAKKKKKASSGKKSSSKEERSSKKGASSKKKSSSNKKSEEEDGTVEEEKAGPEGNATGSSDTKASRRSRSKKPKKKSAPKATKDSEPERASEEAPPGATPNEGSTSDDDAIDLDDEASVSVDELVAATVALDEDLEAVDIDADEDLEDADARAQLIAETLALVASEEAEAGDGAAATEILEIADSLIAKATPEEPGREAPTGPSDDTPGAAAVPDPDAERGTDTRPLIGSQALLALSEIHAEGLASLPDELVLDLGEATSPQERDRLLAAALAHAEMQEAIYRVPTASNRVRWIKFGAAAAIAFVALIVGIRPPALIVPESPPALSAAEVERGVRVALLLQAQQIDAWRVSHGSLPRSLDELPVRLPGIRFLRSSSRSYQLVTYTPLGEPVVYDAAAPSAEFQRLRREWSTTREDT
jgi:hypothetical protein